MQQQGSVGRETTYARARAAFDRSTALGKLNRERVEFPLAEGIMSVPFLVTHGAKDRQIALEYAHQTYGQHVNSPRRELKIFTEREGGVEHVGADNMSFGRDYIADWFAETLGGRTTCPVRSDMIAGRPGRFLP